MCRNSRPTGDILASDVTSLTGTIPKMRRIYTRRPDATRELIFSHVRPVDVCITRAFTASDHEEPTEGHNSFAVLHTCSQLTDEGAVGRWEGNQGDRGGLSVQSEGLESAGQALCVIG
ncbi:hypothetical protein G5I_07739 [Acromyrmex echinatior]|uniref:Uncharacterized protein n=1 Tax=Acromyrmex echinatior TaxID=103372 RepID=F4WPM0_ACREC|nr:hypothetical protein G5I_07739 [Acromyrmex echinatior]